MRSAQAASQAALPLALLLALVVRVPFWVEARRTPADGDMAVSGVMARHAGVGTTLWGQPYGSPLEAWLVAPVVAAQGGTTDGLRLAYFLLGLALPAAGFFLARAVDPRTAAPVAVLLACPPPYFLLLASMPPPLYPLSLLFGAAILTLALRAAEALTDGREPPWRLAAWGVVSGLALWTHLMTAALVAVTSVHLLRRAGWRRLTPAAVLLLVAASPWWGRLVAGELRGAAVVSVTSSRESAFDHLAEVVPRLPYTVLGLLGGFTPLVADDAEHVVAAPAWVAAAIALIVLGALVVAVRHARGHAVAVLLLAAAAVVVVFPFPLRSHPVALRFLTPAYLPLVVALVWAAVARGSVQRAWVLVLALSTLHLLGGLRLLAEWRTADRAAAPFLLPDLGPLRSWLAERGIRHAYASYGPAWRLTFESAERIVASQPWNERFRHEALPFLDEVRFAKDVAWVLTPRIPTDLPPPHEFEAAMARIGGTWKRTDLDGGIVVYHTFAPPYPPEAVPLAVAGAAGDGDPATRLTPSPAQPATFAISPPQALEALTLTSGLGEPRLPRSFDVEVSADGTAFEVVARRRRRGERDDLRWVNGHPQYVLDHDLLAVPLAGRTVAAVRLTPVTSDEPWAVGDILLHPAGAPARPWSEWLDPGLDWPARRRALETQPMPAREDWHWRRILAERLAGPR